jgi:hypothetical protein
MGDRDISGEQIGQLMSLISSADSHRDGTGKSDLMLMLERAAPFIDAKYRKYVSLAAKLIEINQLMTSLNTMAERRGDGIEMLQAIRPELDEHKQGIVDMLVKTMELKKIMEGLNG